MKYKPGDKFILEIGEKTQSLWETYYFLPGVKAYSEDAVINSQILDQLKKYEGEEQQTEYQRGLADAWEAALKILTMRDRDRGEVFGGLIAEIFSKNTAAEAIEKIRKYEEEKEIKVGDEITLLNGLHAVVIKAADSAGKIVSMMSNGNVCSSLKEQVKKTGKHFEEVSTVQDKLLESEEDET